MEITNYNSDNIITSVIVDTSAFYNADFDFLGIKSLRITSFFKAIDEKNILLLTHPIIEKEIENHVSDSSLCTDYDKFVSILRKNEPILDRIGIGDNDALNTIREYNLREKLVSAFRNYFYSAVSLEYTDPKKIFDLYFSGMAPFSESVKKKNEFPDAFVIESVKHYLDEHTNDVIMAVSNDNDWKDAFIGQERVVFCENIQKATDRINSIDSILNDEMLDSIFKGAYQEIISKIQFLVDNELYDLPEYEFTEEPYMDTIDVKSVDRSFDVLSISREDVLIETSVHITVSGEGKIVDETNSCWDSEEKEYLFLSFAILKFENGTVDVDCEIKLAYDFDDPEDSATVKSLKLVDESPLIVQCDNVTITPLDDNELARLNIREDKGMNKF